MPHARSILPRRGARVVINYTKSEAEAKQTAAACEQLGAETLLVQANVAIDADCRRMADAALEKWGRIDGLVNNAGTTKVVFNHADSVRSTPKTFMTSTPSMSSARSR